MTDNSSDDTTIETITDSGIPDGAIDIPEQERFTPEKTVFEEVDERVDWPATEDELLDAISDVIEERRREEVMRTAPQAA